MLSSPVQVLALEPRESAPEQQDSPLLPASEEWLSQQDPATRLLLPSEIPQMIWVEEFRVEGSTVFSPEDLTETLRPFLQRPLTFTDLLEARSTLTALYVDNGYITSRAILPPQTLEEGVVRLQILEGGYEDILIEGLQRLQPGYVRQQLRPYTQTPLNINRLLTGLQQLQLDPLVETVSADLSAGLRVDQSLLQVAVVEADSFAVSLALDNDRTPTVGSLQRSLTIQEANLSGWGDSLRLVYRNTEGSNVQEASYSRPLSARGTRLHLTYNRSLGDIVERPFAQADIRGQAEAVILTLQHPVLQQANQELNLGLSGVWESSATSLLGIPAPLSLEGDEQGRTRLRSLRFFQEWSLQNPRSAVAVRSELRWGLGILGATQNAVPPDGRYLVWRGQAQWSRLLGPETLMLLRLKAQTADRRIPVAEKFTLGGRTTVRGYRQDLYLGDGGFIAGVEVYLPLYRHPEGDQRLQIIPFVDVGSTWNYPGGATIDPATLAAAGLGLSWEGNSVSARLDWGIPLVDVSSQGTRTWQERGIHFSLSTQFF
ncbi:MAG: ShlB/FhaC/HecB family hemolysin secretion/activation protein [Synechococcaceae cyanobacterium SM2_3_1]|nr:ShlB/FhaC/HecB family hemolysin secretion/activation protein [Synechococcaceae cyanobacterium SM2_3_1]